jgi:DNA-binding transcriptional LysR family regulator
LQGIDWDDVRVFLALWRARSLGQAAGRLGVDISTASRRLAALEAQLGTRLFERTREGLVPTHAAEVIQPAAELMESAHARVMRDVSGVETEPEGVVRVSAPAGLIQEFVAPALARLRARHARLRLELDSSTRPVDLVRREQLWIRTSSFPAQLAAARGGAGVLLAPAQTVARVGLVPVALSRRLRASADEWPVDDLWLIGHRALREVPRVAAVWRFLVEALRDARPAGGARRTSRSRPARR